MLLVGLDYKNLGREVFYMRLERTKNSLRNAAYGMAFKVISIVMPFIVRTVFIGTLGVELLGLNSLFTSILTVLNLTELGFSSAIVFCMYKPIANNDSDSINALLAFYKKVYFYIGLIILGIGCSIIPFLTHLINGSYPSQINLVVVYLVFLLNIIISYFLFAYLGSLITAFQRDDMLSKVNIVITTLMYMAQIVILLILRNYYVYILVMPAFTVVNNIRTVVIAKRMFPQYKPVGKLSPEYKKVIKEKVSGLVIFKVCYVSRNAFDTIFISMFFGLTDVAIYNNYYYIMNAIVGITSVLTSSVLSGVGNSIAIESTEKNYNDMNKMNFIYMWIAGLFTTCLLCLYQPFMRIWVGESLMYPFSYVVLLCIYFYILKLGDVRYIYEQAKGLWWEYRFRSISEAVGNIVLNYILGKLFGVAGIIMATIITLFFINYLYGAKVIFNCYFTEQKMRDYFAQNARYMTVTLIACIVTYVMCSFLPFTYWGFVLKLSICIIVPNMIYFVFFKNTYIYKIAMPWFLSKLRIKQ